MEVQNLTCALVIEAANGASRETHKKADLQLARNEFREVLLIVDPVGGKGGRKKKYVLRKEELVVHRKFAAEGKLTIAFKEAGPRLMVSNAPPHRLVRFVKSMAAKLASQEEKENTVKPRMNPRQKLLSGLPSAVDEISPVTLKDVQNLKKSETGGAGLLKMNMSSPVTTGKAKKRTRLSQGGEGAAAAPEGKRRSTEEARQQLLMTDEQKEVLQAVREGQNVFFTGGAGVGKSFMVRKCIGALPPDSTAVTASTGVAAYQVGGVTLHAFAAIGSGVAGDVDHCVESLRRKKGALEQWRRCQHLVVDEVSMVDGRFFERLEAVARAVKNNDRPFGGIQLILTGDFLQLPPVAKGKERRVFCFQTEAWRRCVHRTIELTAVKRQSDTAFVSILNSLRVGQCSKEQEAVLRSTSANKIEGEGILATRLCTHTDDAHQINREELAALPGSARAFAASDSVPGMSSYLDQMTPVDSRLVLKVGAQVMLMKNLNVARGLVNGARGKVAKFSKPGGWPVVKFACGREEEIKQEKWGVKGGGQQASTVFRKQLPLKLAWAFSIHKSQGMTLERAEVNLSKVFECGQAYVALSRARSLDSVRIVDFRKECIVADPRVIRFYRDIGAVRPVRL